MQNITGVCIRLRLDESGKNRLRYAVDLALLLSVPLWIKCPNSPQFFEFSGMYCDANDFAIGSERKVVQEFELPHSPRFIYGDQQVSDPGSVIFIADSSEVFGPEVRYVIYPAFFGTMSHQPSCLIPLGAHDTGLRALEYAIPYLKAVNAEVILYHTTYKIEEVEDEDPIRHISEPAKQVVDSAKILISKHLIKCSQVIIEKAAQVQSGIIKAALTCREGRMCDLIIAARGARVIKGSYVDLLIHESVVPVMVVR